MRARIVRDHQLPKSATWRTPLDRRLRFGASSANLVFGKCSGHGRISDTSYTEETMPLTKRQHEILDYLTEYTESNGYAPSFEEIAARFNYNSLATVHEHLSNLERKRYIRRRYNESRAIEILPSDVFARAVDLPLMGLVAAGSPIEAVAHGEHVAVPEGFLGRTAATVHVLRVRGNSMIDEQIRDGDYVVVHERQRADKGKWSSRCSPVTSDGQGLYRERDGRVRLQPANEAMAPMTFTRTISRFVAWSWE